MTDEYRIEPSGSGFRVLDPWGEYLVDLFPTKRSRTARYRAVQARRSNVTAQQLVDIAIEVHMQKFGIDRETAEFWIHGAMGG